MERMDNSYDFFSWLAEQPAFIEVAVGAFFCLVVAPIMLAGIATAVSAFEGFIETRLAGIDLTRAASVRGAKNAGWPLAAVETMVRLGRLTFKRQLQKL
jgi:hypothetical protein